MRLIITLFGSFLAFVAIVLTHFSVSYLLPAPLSAVNSVFVLLILHMLIKESGIVVWLGFFVFFIIELYGAGPFGISMGAATFALLFTYWMYQHVFTNKSWYTAFTLSASAILLFRLFWLLGMAVTSVGSGTSTGLWDVLSPVLLYELFLTASVTTVLFLGCMKILQTIAPIKYRTIYEHTTAQRTFRF